MDEETHLLLAKRAGDFKRIDKMLRATENRIRQFEDMGWPPVLDAETKVRELSADLESILDALSDEIAGIMEETEFAPWIEEASGIGLHGVGLVTGLLPRPQTIDNVRSTWALLGLHVGEDGRAPRRKRGEWSGFDPLARAYALYRTAIAAWKQGDYRHVYVERREHTLETHPPMFEEDDPSNDLAHPECLTCIEAVEKTKTERDEHEYDRARQAPRYDCSNLGGVHWTRGHRHKDAIRVTTKEIFKDWWRVAHGQAPLLGQGRDDGQRTTDRQEVA